MTRRILVVEDDPDQALELSDRLTASDWLVTIASDVAEAMRCLYECRPVAALVDINLPDRNGIRFAEMATVLDFRLPIVLMSGDPEVLNVEFVRQSGALGALAKPVDFAVLRAMLAGL